VVSAFQGVTNQLLECARLAAKADRRTELGWKKIVHRHLSAVDIFWANTGVLVSGRKSILWSVNCMRCFMVFNFWSWPATSARPCGELWRTPVRADCRGTHKPVSPRTVR